MNPLKKGELYLRDGKEVYYNEGDTIEFKEKPKDMGWDGNNIGLTNLKGSGYCWKLNKNELASLTEISPKEGFKIGDKVRIRTDSRYHGKDGQVEEGIITSDEGTYYKVKGVGFDGTPQAQNTYESSDLDLVKETPVEGKEELKLEGVELVEECLSKNKKGEFEVGDIITPINTTSLINDLTVGGRYTVISFDISLVEFIRDDGKKWKYTKNSFVKVEDGVSAANLLDKIKEMEIYKTTEGEFVAKGDDGIIHYFDKDGKETDQIEGEITSKLRSDSAIHEQITKTLASKKEKRESRTLIDKIKGFDVFLDRKDFSLNIDINGEVVQLDKEGIDKLKGQMKAIEKIKIDVATQATTCKLGDRVLLFGPTGTGKTFDFLSTVKEMEAAGQLDEHHIVTITEGVEDIDFLAHIVPTATGIKYSEKHVVTLLREAAAGKKVAILLDELNRGGKAFLNLVLKLLDAVDGDNYVLDNYLNDEQIVIPQKNVLFFATMNLGGKYTGTNALDEALFDRFNRVNYKGYNPAVEADMFKAFGAEASNVSQIVDYVRSIHSDGEIRAPISTRGVKMWAEAFINSGKTKEDLLNTFRDVLLNRLTSVDDFGNPNREEEGLILRKFKDLGIIS